MLFGLYRVFVRYLRLVHIENKYLKSLLSKIFLLANKFFFDNPFVSDCEYFIRKNKIFYDFNPELHDPGLFREKIIWRILYDRNPMYTLCADKYKVRDYVERRIGCEYLKPLIKVIGDPDEIIFSELPDDFVVKPNHGSGWIIFVNKKNVEVKKIKKAAKRWMRSNYACVGHEWHYKDIKPLIMIEEFIFEDDVSPPEYRIYCFDGKVECVQKTHVDVDVYDGLWRLMYSTCNVKKSRESCLSEKTKKAVIDIAERLSQGFDHVRVDLLVVNNEKIYFNELTFTDGTYESVWPLFQTYLGEKWKLKRNKYCLQHLRLKKIV